MWFVSILVGMGSVAIGIYLLKKEIRDAVSATSSGQSPEEWRRQLDELGASFFDIVNDLEGKYSVHERQIQDMEYLLSDYKEQKLRQPKKVLPLRIDGLSSNQDSVMVNHQKGKQSEQNPPSNRIRREDGNRQKKAFPDDSMEKLYTRGAKSVEIRENSAFGAMSEQSLESEARRLLQQGYKPPEIARKLGIGVGELRLILGMSEHKDVSS